MPSFTIHDIVYITTYFLHHFLFEKPFSRVEKRNRCNEHQKRTEPHDAYSRNETVLGHIVKAKVEADANKIKRHCVNSPPDGLQYNEFPSANKWLKEDIFFMPETFPFFKLV